MAALPISFIVSWLVTVVTLLVFGGGLYLLWAWSAGILEGTAYLFLGSALMVWTCLGRWIVLVVFRAGGPDEPRTIRPDAELQLSRPDGSELHVQMYGSDDAPPLVLTHGAGTDHTSWYYLIHGLSSRFRVITWDRAGLGASRASKDHDHSLQKQAGDLDAVLGVAEGRPAVLVGHSMGGMTVLTFCELFPQQLGTTVAGLGLVDTSHTNPAMTSTAAELVHALQKPVLEPLLRLTVWLSPLFSVVDWLSYGNGTAHLAAMYLGFAGSETRGQLDVATRSLARSSPAVRAREALAMLHYDATHVLSEIFVPVLVFTGNKDRLIVPETAGWIRQSIPKTRLVRLEPAGHMCIFECGRQVSTELSAFVDSVQRPTPQRRTPGDVAGEER